jgi:hypothetical protein
MLIAEIGTVLSQLAAAGHLSPTDLSGCILTFSFFCLCQIGHIYGHIEINGKYICHICLLMYAMRQLRMLRSGQWYNCNIILCPLVFSLDADDVDS